jgi:CheY-like chemotaxis protein
MTSHLQPFASPIQWSRVQRPKQSSSGEARSPGSRGATILAVDDEPDALDFLRAFLAPEGFEFVQAASGAQALALIEEQRPDLLIVDVMMPGMTGLELCDILREHVETRDIPIIIYSAHDLREHSNSGLYDHAFLKPADPDQLLWAIRTLLPEDRH